VLGVRIRDDAVALTNVATTASLLDLWKQEAAAPGNVEASVRALGPTGLRLRYADLDVEPDPARPHLVLPVDVPEVWAAGVTYARSLAARHEETVVKNVYDRVYDADRPEVFFKATASRCVGPNAYVRIRADSYWTVPEPEIGLVLSASGDIVGYTLGNDMSARDIEGANPLYLPQAKIYDNCCSVGPAVLLSSSKPGRFSIACRVTRLGTVVFQGETSTDQMRRPFEELVRYLTRDNTIPDGTVLLTGTGIVPTNEFSLRDGDTIEISSPEIGVLRNLAVQRQSI